MGTFRKSLMDNAAQGNCKAPPHRLLHCHWQEEEIFKCSDLWMCLGAYTADRNQQGLNFWVGNTKPYLSGCGILYIWHTVSFINYKPCFMQLLNILGKILEYYLLMPRKTFSSYQHCQPKGGPRKASVQCHLLLFTIMILLSLSAVS